jgi:uncharacterized protein (TIGR02246 family)
LTRIGAGCLAALAAFACGQPATDDPRGAAAEMLDRSAAAWNAGDLDRFVSDYADDTATTFVAEGRPQYGYDWIRSHYAPVFQPGASRDSLRFENVAARSLGRDHRLVTARFVLHRGDSVTASGPFTLILRRDGDTWKIIHDHTSSDPR